MFLAILRPDSIDQLKPCFGAIVLRPGATCLCQYANVRPIFFSCNNDRKE